MKTITCHLVYFIVNCMIPPNQSLVELSQTRNHFIARTESMIRNITNELFITMRLKIKDNPRLKQFKIVHNFFTSITLRDDDNLNKLARMTNVRENDNITQHFITEINEVLNNDDENKDATDDVYITQYIDTFFRGLKDLTDKHGFNEDDLRFNINSDILKLLAPNDDFSSVNNTEEDDTILSDHEFWKNSEENYRRIFQGKRTRIKKFPFMASVQFFKKFQCGGSIIKSDLIITAASCLQLAWNNRLFRENPAFLSVQVGSDFYQGGGENIAVLEIYFHPQYTPKTLQNNLAIMRLIRRLKFKRKSKKIKKIDFDRNPWALPFNTPGITVIGWGARQSNNVLQNFVTNRLAYAVLDVYPLQDCQEVYSKDFVTRKHFCAGYISKGGGACNHDVGGPGVSDDRLVGVISFGSVVCGEADSPTVFTKLGYYTDWIEEIMEQEVPQVKVRTTRRPLRTTTTTPPPETTYRILPIVTDHDNHRLKEDDPLYKQLFVDSDKSDEPIKGDVREVNSIFDDFLSTMFGSSENDTSEEGIRELNSAPDKFNLRDKFSLRDLNQTDMQSLFEILDEKLHGVTEGSDSNEPPRTEFAPFKSNEEAPETDSEGQIKPPSSDSRSGETQPVRVTSNGKVDDVTPEGIFDQESRSIEDINQLSIEVNEHDMVTKPIIFEDKKDTPSEKESVEKESIEKGFEKESVEKESIEKEIAEKGFEKESVEKESFEKSSAKVIGREDKETPDSMNWDNFEFSFTTAKNNEQFSEITTKKIKKTTKLKKDHKPKKNDHQIHESESKSKKKVEKTISFSNEVTQQFTAVTHTLSTVTLPKYTHTATHVIQDKKIKYASEESIEDKKSHKKDKPSSKTSTTDKSIDSQNHDNYIDTIAEKIDEAMVITDDKVEIDIMKLIQSLDIRKDWPESKQINNTNISEENPSTPRHPSSL